MACGRVALVFLFQAALNGQSTRCSIGHLLLCLLVLVWRRLQSYCGKHFNGEAFRKGSKSEKGSGSLFTRKEKELGSLFLFSILEDQTGRSLVTTSPYSPRTAGVAQRIPPSPECDMLRSCLATSEHSFPAARPILRRMRAAH